MSLELSALQLGEDKAERDCDTLRLIPVSEETHNEQTRGLPNAASCDKKCRNHPYDMFIYVR